MSADDPGIRNVSDTALWVAMYRALESERPDAHFRDPWARRLAGERGERILREMPQGHTFAWPMVVRTVVFDEIITRLVREEGVDGVLDLAAGLDARPWRMDLPASLRWVDVDLAEMLEYKRKALAGEAPRFRYQAIAADLRVAAERPRAIREATQGATRVLVLTEGLIIYLAQEDVAALARDLAAVPAIRWWLTDLSSPALLRRLQGRKGGLSPANAPFRFAPAEGTRFFEPYGWREREFRSTFVESRRLKREMPHAWIWRLLGSLASKKKQQEFQRFAGSVLLERA